MYLVVFRARKRPCIDRAVYNRAAERMEELAESQPGYLSFKSYIAADGETVAISEWRDEASARAWGRHAEHLVARARGQKEWYLDYTMYAVDNPYTRRFVAKD